MRLHDEHWWKCGQSQILCRHDMHPWALKPSHTVKAYVLSNHVKFRNIQAQVEEISTLAPFTAQRVASVDNGISDGLFNWKTFHDISIEFQQRFRWWEWQKMTMRLHDERWWKCGWSQNNAGTTCILEPWNPPTLWRHVSYLTMSNFDAYRHKLKGFQHWTHSLLNVRCRWIMAMVMGLLIGRCSMTFKESFDNDSIDGNDEWWQWDCMMNANENVDDLKDYAGMTCIIEPWNHPTHWRHVSYLTMSNFDAYRHKLKEFECWPHSPLNVRCRWIMALVVGFVIGRCSMTFQESLDKDSINGNGEWQQWDYMMNVDENVDDLKHYAGMTCILEPWNPPAPWRHVSYLTMSNFDAYRHKLKKFQSWPLSLLNVRCRWIMASMMGL
jgi:hypothetical protein